MKTQTLKYKDTTVAPNSELGKALADYPKSKKVCEQIYKQTTEAFDRLYPKGDRQWFEQGGIDAVR